MHTPLSQTPIERFIPHRKPMLLLDYISHAEPQNMQASFTVDAQCAFLQEDGTLEAVALLEILAQCFAAGNGVTNPKSFGYLASMRHMRIHDTAKVGDTLLAKVEVVGSLGDIMIVDGKLYKGHACIAEGQYKLFSPVAASINPQEEK